MPIEVVQDYWDQRPCNIRHSPQLIGTRAYFDEVEARKYFVEPHIPIFADFGRWRGLRVLEIGCGIGTDTINFARSGASVTAVELSGKSLAIARQRASVYGLEDRIRFYQANVEELSSVVPVEPFDLIYSFGVVHHTPNPDRALAEMRRFARAGTTLKIMVYHRYSWKVLSIAATSGPGRIWRLKEIVARNSEAQTGCPVTYTYSRQEARNLVEGHGFRTDDGSVDHIFPYQIPDYVQYRYRRTWYFRYLPGRWFRWLEQHFGWHLCITGIAGD